MTSTFACSSWAAHPWRPAVAPDAVHRPPPRRHRYCRLAVGNCRPSAPTPMPLTGTAAPGAGPGACPGAWSRGRTAAVEPEHGEGHSLLWPRPAAARRTSVGQSAPPSPLPVTALSPRPSATATDAWPAAGDCCPLGPRPDAGAPGTRPPLPAPGGKPGDGTPTPWSICPVRKFFLKNHSRGITPHPDGTRPQKLSNQFERGITQRNRLAECPLKSVYTLLWCVPASTKGLAQDQGGVIAGGAFGERGRTGEGRRPQCRFQPACCLWHQPYLQGFCYTNDMEKLARERLLASKLYQQAGFSRSLVLFNPLHPNTSIAHLSVNALARGR